MFSLYLAPLTYFLLAAFLSFGQLFNSKFRESASFFENVLLGFCFFVIFINFLFFFFKINLIDILQILIISFIIVILINFSINKSIFFASIKEIFFITIFPTFVFLLVIIFYSEQFYVFRGNTWDWFGFVSAGNYIANINVEDFLNLNNNFSKEAISKLNQFDKELNAYHFTVKTWIDKIPTLALILGLFIKINSTEPFLMAFFCKFFFLTLLTIAFYEFIKIYVKENTLWKNIFYTQVLVFSFWTIYILEADYFRFISSFSIFIFILININRIFYLTIKKNWQFILIYIFSLSTLLLLYPEILFVYFLIFIVFYLIDKDKNIFFFIDNFIKLLVSLFIILFLIYPNINLLFDFVINQIKSTGTENRWWTYFGAFIFGSDSPSLNVNFSSHVKKLIQLNARDLGSGIYHDNLSLVSIIKIIHVSLVEFNYQSVYLNVIPSLFGFYFLTSFKFVNFLFLLIFSVYIIYFFLKNLLFVFSAKNKKIFLFKSVYIVFFFLSFYFIIQGKLWTVIKLYMFLSPFIAFMIFFNFKGKKNIVSPNIFLIIIMLIFPIYKFKDFNFGIGVHDSLPSIQKPEMKLNIKWKFDPEKINNCGYINLKFTKWDYYDPNTISDHFKSIYFTINLVNNNFIFINHDLLKNKDSKARTICSIKNF